MSEQTTLRRCPRHPATCKLFEAAGFCAHSQEFDRILWRDQRWLERHRSGMPSDATSDRHWLVEAVLALTHAPPSKKASA